MSATKTHHRWRENVEALTMAIVVALLFKYFVLEISKIPSGSMQPTLMGDPVAGVFDRTVVDKLSFHFRDPVRFEIVVFKHPLEQSRVMVKRLVGMPGEDLRVEGGDLWTRAKEGEPWRILRRPPAVVREMLRALPPAPGGRDWSLVRGGKEWQIRGDAIAARGDGAARFHADRGPKDEYYDGYPEALLADFQQRYAGRGENAVGDLRLEGELVALEGTSSVSIELTEGQRTYEFTLPGPAAAPDSTVSVSIRDARDSSTRVERGERFALGAGARVDFAVENLDDRLSLELDGRPLLAAEIAANEEQQAQITLSVSGAGADFAELRVLRDVYYQAPEGRSWSTTIPPGHYVMMGDNTHDSADSRLWEAQSYTVRAGGATLALRGNLRRGENPLFPRLSDGTPAVRFKDELGEVHWFAEDAVQGRSLEGKPAPLVPRELILGRAVAIFWPINPLQGLWRLGWLR